MGIIEIHQMDNEIYKVMIADEVPTTHLVTVKADYAQRFIGNRYPVSRLIEESFNFLLAREPNTSILRSFDLSVISRYFSAYEHEMLSRLENPPA